MYIITWWHDECYSVGVGVGGVGGNFLNLMAQRARPSTASTAS